MNAAGVEVHEEAGRPGHPVGARRQRDDDGDQRSEAGVAEQHRLRIFDGAIQQESEARQGCESGEVDRLDGAQTHVPL